ncbi:MAG: peptidoglycan DD-metalloendopeptidase family protein [Pseudomonadota bacterium]
MYRSGSLGPALAVSAFLILASAPLLRAQDQAAQGDEREKLESLEQAAEEDQAEAQRLAAESQALKQEMQNLQVQLVGAARKAQEQESDLLALQGALQGLEKERAELTDRLSHQEQNLQVTLAALQRIALLPDEAQLLAPGAPLERVRSAMLLQVAVPAIEDRAESLRGTLTELALVKKRIRNEKAALLTGTADLEQQQAAISSLIQKKGDTWERLQDDQKNAADRARKLVQEATDLRDLLTRLEREQAEKLERMQKAAQRAERQRKAASEQALALSEEQAQSGSDAIEAGQVASLARPSTTKTFSENGKNLLLPARGALIGRYGQANGGQGGFSGDTAKGIVIETRAGAQVVAPFDGQVVYAGDFRSYGRILIIDHGERYHSLLAGLGRTNAVVGQWVLAGEPVATMDQGGGQATANLYLELRRAGQPINPLPWLNVAGLNSAEGQ